MVRKATEADIPAVTAIYDALLDREEQGLLSTGWTRGVYPAEQTARDALRAGTLYVMEREGRVTAAAKIDQSQMEQYSRCRWQYSSIGTTFRSCSSSAIKCVLTRSLLKITSSRSADCPNNRWRTSSPATKKTGPITGAKSITAARILPPVRFPGSSLQCCSFHRTYAAVTHKLSTTSSRKYVSILLIVPSPLSSCTESLRS